MEDQVLDADWLAQRREVACCVLQKRLEERVLRFGSQEGHKA